MAPGSFSRCCRKQRTREAGHHRPTSKGVSHESRIHRARHHGASLAANLQKAQHKVTVHDARRAAADGHIEAGADLGRLAAEVARNSDVVFTSLPGPPEVEAVALGPDGILAGMKRGGAYFDLSTNSRATVRKIAAAFAEKGAHMLDAPVSGGPQGAKTGKLAIWVGGDKDVFEQVQGRAGRHGRPGALCRADRPGDGGQAGAQLRRLRDATGAGRGLHHGRQGGRRSARRCGRRCARARWAAGAPSTG